ncbi:MAG: methionyl-tRNA formyltransferase [bacterium]
MDKKRLIFFGTSRFAEIILESLLKNDDFEVCAIVTKPDKPAGRKKILTPSVVKKLAQKNEIIVFQPEKLKDQEFTEKIRDLKPKIIVVASYGKIIPKEILGIPEFGCLNVHGSLLPEYRGASPIQFALLDGKKETGITIMLMDEGMDTGPILLQKKIGIDLEDNLLSLSEKMAHLGAELLKEALPKWISGEITPQKQDNSSATYSKISQSGDFEINWGEMSRKIANRIRAFYPNAFGMVKFGGKSVRMKVLEVKEYGSAEEEQCKGKKIETGSLFKIGKKLFCLCGDGALELIIIQPEGKKPMSGKDFLNGHPEI